VSPLFGCVSSSLAVDRSLPVVKGLQVMTRYMCLFKLVTADYFSAYAGLIQRHIMKNRYVDYDGRGFHADRES